MGDSDLKVTNSPSPHATRLAAEHRAWLNRGFVGHCPVRDVLERVGDTWTVLVVLRLGEQPMRFRELLRAVEGISQRMLTVTLRALERDGLVLRRVFDTRPPAVQYRLTARGVSLLEPVTALALWALQNDPGIERSRAAFDQGAN